ncbi:MAG: hypothetical protein VYE73_08435 [Acidobacteriota bacterium]|nr:hypothetical protein [Acidobacteriota bacterium]
MIAYLRGHHYATSQDEWIYLVTHTDGPSISQDNGGYGILGVVHYLSQIPQSERSRTLILLFDNRHYMPGMERVFAEQGLAPRPLAATRHRQRSSMPTTSCVRWPR